VKLQQLGQQVKALRVRWHRLKHYLRWGIWDTDIQLLSAGRGFVVRALRIVQMVFKGFRDDECSMHASALTFSSLMSIVPVLALMLSMARGLGDADTAKSWVQDRVRDWTETFQSVSVEQQAAVDADDQAAHQRAEMAALLEGDAAEEWEGRQELASRINAMVEAAFDRVDQINFARLGTVGLVLLIWMVIEVLGRVERSFNRVWGIARGRNLWRRFTDYMSVLLILPILIVAAASVPVVDLVTSHMPDRTAAHLYQFVESGFFKSLVVIVMTTLSFAFVIMFMPNTSMKVSSGLTGGFVAAILFLLWLWICAMVQVGAARYGRIYGSFAVVPIVLAWVHVSWQIVLFGAEVAFSVENAATYRMEKHAADASIAARLTLAVLILREAGLALHGEHGPFDVGHFVKARKVPVRFVHAVVEELVHAGYLGSLAGASDVYVLLRSAEHVKMRDVLHTMLHAGSDTTSLGLRSELLEPSVVDAVQQALGTAEQELDRISVAALLPQRAG